MILVQIDKIYNILKKDVVNYKVPVIDLVEAQTKDPFKVLVATIMSARTKDQTTTLAAGRLFHKVKKPADLKKLHIKKIEKLIYPVGFYKNKAKYLKKLPGALKEFKNKIPNTVEDLIKLPGVGRKTANLVVAVAFRKPALAVDVHCHRIPQRIGWFRSKSPFETEIKLKKIIPKKHWKDFNRIFVAFGQHTCRPISPHCWECPITKFCDYYKKIYLKNKAGFSV